LGRGERVVIAGLTCHGMRQGSAGAHFDAQAWPQPQHAKQSLPPKEATKAKETAQNPGGWVRFSTHYRIFRVVCKASSPTCNFFFSIFGDF
jgi:hypothetical protein